jgi:hypothetical protein
MTLKNSGITILVLTTISFSKGQMPFVVCPSTQIILPSSKGH